MTFKFKPVLVEGSDEAITSILYIFSVILLCFVLVGSFALWSLPPDFLTRLTLLSIVYYFWYVNTINKRRPND